MLDNPIEAYLRVAEARNRNRQQSNQDIASIGQSLGQGLGAIGQQMQTKQKDEDWHKTINNILNDPNTSPQVKQMLPMMVQRPELAGQILPGLMKPQKPTSPWVVVPGMLSRGGKPVQENKETGETREAGIDVQPTANPRSEAMSARTDYLNKALDYRQRDLLSKNTNLPAQQLKTLTQNNIRADRALDLLNKPGVTWQALSFAITDLGAIMQGGVPHKEQLLDAQFPSWKQKVAQYRTYATGQPTANVPEPIRNEVMNMIQSLKKVDNQFLEQNKDLQMKMLGPTVQGFDKLKPIIEQGTQNFMGKSGDMSKMSDDELRRIAGGR